MLDADIQFEIEVIRLKIGFDNVDEKIPGRTVDEFHHIPGSRNTTQGNTLKLAGNRIVFDVPETP